MGTRHRSRFQGVARRGARSDLVAIACGVALFGCSGDGASGPRPSRPSGTGGAGAQAGAGVAGAAGNGFGNSVTAGAGAAAGSSAQPPSGMAGGPSETCAEGNATATPVTPVVWLVVDGSSSMNNSFEAGSTRWQTLRTTLMSPTGVVASLEHVAKFGLVIYSGGNTDPAQCVKLVIVEPALDNFAAIDAAYPADPIGMGTPTDQALDHVVTTLPVVAQQMPDKEADPVYVVLATDGQPNDNCGGMGAGTADDATVRQRVVDVVTRGTMAGMQMFVISLAGGDRDLQAHLEQVAMATASKTPPFVPATQAELITTFEAIVGGASCLIALDGTVADGKECTGTVTLNGQVLACAADDGFNLADPRTIQLTGTACTSFLGMQSMVHASFPCEAFAPD
jgi:hypothetical protein